MHNVTKVLLVSGGDAALAELRKLVLESGGYTVVAAGGAAEAARKLAEEAAAIAVVDCDDHRAMEVCQAIRSTKPDLPIVGLEKTYVRSELASLLDLQVHKLDGPKALLTAISERLSFSHSDSKAGCCSHPAG